MMEYDKKWNMKYEKLVEFKRTNGHCMVPCKYEQDKSLGRWVMNQRARQNKIRLDRKTILDEIGFAWKGECAPLAGGDRRDKKWNRQYEQLVEFKRKNGHCMVPSKYEQDKALGKWVSFQRTYYNNNRLLLDRKRLLGDLGFAWKDDGALTLNQYDKRWHQDYERLVEFKRINYNCKVPYTKNKNDNSLAVWVTTQRARHANKIMLPDRKELLDKIGFGWKVDPLSTRSSTTNVRGLAI
jgi:hypothetical protein